MSSIRSGSIVALLLIGLAPACDDGKRGVSTEKGNALPSPAPNGAVSVNRGGIEFVDVTQEAGIAFTHVNGAIGHRHLPETMGGSAAFFDADGDGDLDLFLGQSGGLADTKDRFASAQNGFYRNDGAGRFQDFTADSNDGRRTGYGQGVTAGDYDGDGRVDLYVTNYGPNVLLRNRDGTAFDDVSTKAGVADPAWSASATFFDMDADGDLDLYVANYVQFSLTDYKRLSKDPNGFLAYPHPDQFKSARDSLYRNDGNGTFTDVTTQAGIVDLDGKGLGVIASDLDVDGDLDLYVANDSTPNFLFRNDGGHFVDWTEKSNAGYNRDGITEAGMGIAVGDSNNDLLPDLFVTNLDGETNTLYVNRKNLVFEDLTDLKGLAPPASPFVGFGTTFLDVDFDGDLDLFVGNGHIIDNIADVWVGSGVTYAERSELFINNGKGSFKSLIDDLPAALKVPRVVRAVARGDYDNDGDVDLMLVQNNRPAALLRNDSKRVGKSLELELVDAKGASAYGASVIYRFGDQRRIVSSLACGSYCASSDPRVVLGAPVEKLDEIEIHFVGGAVTKLVDVAMDRRLKVGPTGILADSSASRKK